MADALEFMSVMCVLLPPFESGSPSKRRLAEDSVSSRKRTDVVSMHGALSIGHTAHSPTQGVFRSYP